MSFETVSADDPGSGPRHTADDAADPVAGTSPAQHLLDVALGRAESRPFWTDVVASDGRAEPPVRRWRRRMSTGAPRRRVYVAAAAVIGMAVIGVVMVGGAVVVTRGGDGPLGDRAAPAGSNAAATSGPNPATTAPATSFAEGGRAELGIELPEHWAGRCRPAPALDREADAALVCEPASGPVRVELRRIDDNTRRDAVFLDLAGRPPSGTGPSRCALGWPEVRTWSRAGTPDTVAGAYRCAAVAGRSEVVWTDNDHALLVRAIGRDGDLAAIYRWWSTDAPGA